MSQVSSIVFFIVLAFHFHHSDQMKVTHGNAHSSNRIQTQLYNLLDCTTIYYLIVTRSSLYFSFSWTFVMHHNISSPTTLCGLSRQQSKSLLCRTPHDNPKFPVDLSQVHSTNKFLLCRDLLQREFKVFNMPRNIFLVKKYSKYSKFSKFSNMPRNIFLVQSHL